MQKPLDVGGRGRTRIRLGSGALDEDRFTAGWRQGREMPLDDAIAYALEEETARIQR